jgi:hypothetical protein
MYDILPIAFIIFAVLFMIYVGYRQSQVTKKSFQFIDQSHKIAVESLEVNKLMLKELEKISKNLK